MGWWEPHWQHTAVIELTAAAPVSELPAAASRYYYQVTGCGLSSEVSSFRPPNVGPQHTLTAVLTADMGATTPDRISQRKSSPMSASPSDACLVLPCLALPCLALPCLALPCLALPCLALPCLALPCLALPCLALPDSTDQSGCWGGCVRVCINRLGGGGRLPDYRQYGSAHRQWLRRPACRPSTLCGGFSLCHRLPRQMGDFYERDRPCNETRSVYGKITGSCHLLHYVVSLANIRMNLLRAWPSSLTSLGRLVKGTMSRTGTTQARLGRGKGRS
jgi:hypothetical protein